METHLFRFRVNGRLVGAIMSDGGIMWEDLDLLKDFVGRHIFHGVLRDDHGVIGTTAVDIDLMSTNPTRVGEASVKLEFGRVERSWIQERDC